MRILVVGATGNVGRRVMKMLVESAEFSGCEIRCSGSKKSAGSSLQINDRLFAVEDTANINFYKDEICVFNTEAEVSAHYAPKALSAGAYVVDSSSHYRLWNDVPLVVPHIVKVDISQAKLFAHSNCIVSPIASVVYPLHQAFKVVRIIASTYQSVSGAGKSAMDECFTETQYFCDTGIRRSSKMFNRSMTFNVIPQIGPLESDGLSGEESKIEKELQKIIDKKIIISATAVRVPVMVGHSISLSIELNKQENLHSLLEVLKSSARVKLSNDYHTPIELSDKEEVFVGRIRSNPSANDRWYHMWLCSDNLSVGAAADAFEIVKEIARQI